MHLFFLCGRRPYGSPVMTKPCHFSIICPVSPLGKQSMSFMELLCFPFTLTDKAQMNQGLFSWRDRMRGKRNMNLTFQNPEEGTRGRRKRDNCRYIFCQPKIVFLTECYCQYAVCIILADLTMDTVYGRWKASQLPLSTTSPLNKP